MEYIDYTASEGKVFDWKYPEMHRHKDVKSKRWVYHHLYVKELSLPEGEDINDNFKEVDEPE